MRCTYSEAVVLLSQCYPAVEKVRKDDTTEWWVGNRLVAIWGTVSSGTNGWLESDDAKLLSLFSFRALY